MTFFFSISLTTNAETTESRCEELNRQIEELSKQFRSEKRRNDKIIEEQNKQDEIKRTELLKPKPNTSLPSDVSPYSVSPMVIQLLKLFIECRFSNCSPR